MKSAIFVSILLLTGSLHMILARRFSRQMSRTVVNTQFGKMRGVLVQLPQSTGLPPVQAYYGIQYASLLDGDLRFMPPTSTQENWEGIRVALRFRPVCPQPLPDLKELEKTYPPERVESFRRILPWLEKQSEDCLNLNLYVPSKDAETGNEFRGYPVVVFIHGESFEMGTGNAYDGSVLASYGQVIVVTLNYRLGVLGFLQTGYFNFPYNYALLDLVAALHWIQENIESFGGDPNSVTLLGHGNGAALVDQLLLASITSGRHLFHRAIIMSHSSNDALYLAELPVYYHDQLSLALNCSMDSYWECKMSASASVISGTGIKPSNYMNTTWRHPYEDGKHYLLANYRQQLMAANDSTFKSVELLLGEVRKEGFRDSTNNNIDFGRNGERLKKTLDIENTKELEQDTSSVVELARQHAFHISAPTYLYSFNYPSHRPHTHLGPLSDPDHEDPLAFVLGSPLVEDGIDPFRSSSYSNSDRKLSEIIMTYWSNFIWTGNPNLSGESKGRIVFQAAESDSVVSRSNGENAPGPLDLQSWPSFDLENQKYLYIDPSGLTEK